MKRSFVVTVEMPPGVDVVYMAEYIRTAVEAWTGGMDPADPLGCIEIDATVCCTIGGVQFKTSKE